MNNFERKIDPLKSMDLGVTLKRAILKLEEELKKDPEYYYAWQSNIAMSFFDEYSRCNKKYKNKEDIRRISNDAAKSFLNLLSD